MSGAVLSLPVTEQLRAATTAYRDAVEVERRAAARWHEAITDAVEDAGVTIKDVAALVGVSTARVHKIVATTLARAS